MLLVVATQRSGELAEPPDEIDGLFRSQGGGIDLAELFEQRVGQRGEEAAGQQGTARLDLADRAGGGAGVGAVLLFEEGEDLAGPFEHRGRDAGQARDVDAVALVGAAGDDPVEEDDLPLALADGDVGVAEPRLGLLELDELVVVGGEQGAAADDVVQVLGDRPGERDAVEGAGAAADLVEDDQAAAAWRC